MKKKVFLLITIVIVIILIAILVYYIYTKTHVKGFTKVGGFTQTEIDKSKAVSNIQSLKLVRITYSIFDDTKGYSKDDACNYTIIREYILICNKGGKIIDTRAKETGYSSDSLQKEYNKLNGMNMFYTNVSIKDSSLYYNTNYLNGSTLDEIKKALSSQANYKYEEL